jgi:hypothetical protein
MKNKIIILLLALIVSACSMSTLPTDTQVKESVSAVSKLSVEKVPTLIPTPTPDILRLVGNWNLRSAGDADADKIGELYDGQIVTVVTRLDGWALIQAETDKIVLTGFINLKCCKEIK